MPEEYDITPILQLWMEDEVIIKWLISKSGGITVYINDGVTADATADDDDGAGS